MLFNGGALYPAAPRDRICQQIGKWQDGSLPRVLENAEPDLAVARGAARFGRIVSRKEERIQSGAPRAVFLEAYKRQAGNGAERAGPSLVCILPRGAAAEEMFEIADLPLELRINRPVRFQTYYSTRHGRSKAGELFEWNPRDFHPLPPLETVAKVADAPEGDTGRTVPITLSAKVTDLGLLQVSCRSAAANLPKSWPLEFNLRPHEHAPAAPALDLAGAAQGRPNVEASALTAARSRLNTVFSRPTGKGDKLSAARLLQSLEKILGLPKGDWNWELVRSLWPPLEASIACRKHSVEHEETWLILAGFLLRPGFGAALDEGRIDSLWRIRDAGLYFPGKRIKLQEHILWRRVAGGLSRVRQERVLASELDKLRQQKNPPPELIRLAGSLERIGHDVKSELVRRFIDKATGLARAKQHCAPYLAALSLLLNRSPLYAGPETVVSPALVELAYDGFSGFDWADPELSEMQSLFLRAARVVDDRSLDLPKALRNRIAGRLEQSGVAPVKTARIRDYMPVDRSERAGLYGESLPPGLILGGG